MGLAILVVLTLLVIAASFALTASIRSRSEALVAASLAGNTIVVAPVYVWGLLDVLNRWSLGLSVLVSCVGSIAWFAIARGRGWPRALADRTVEILYLPFDAIGRTWRRRSLLFVGAVAATCFVPYFLLVAYLAPAWRDWDGIWYHETMIGFTIQNHGFRMVPLPQGLQYINGVQRLGEMTQLFFGIYGGRRVVDVANVFFMPLLAASMYALAHRYTRDAVASVAAGAGIVLFPGFLRLVQSTMVDCQAAALLLAAAYFVTHPELNRRNSIYAIVGLTLAVGAKIWFIVPVSFFSLYLLVRLVRRRRENGGLVTGLLIAVGVFLVVGMQATNYLRNYIHFHNPFWPILSIDIPKLGIHWKGILEMNFTASRAGVDFNEPFDVMWKKMTAAPYTAMGPGHTWQVQDYGFGWTWVVLPLCGVALVVVSLRWALGFVARRTFRSDADVSNAMMLAFVGFVSIYVSPAIFIGRYHIASLGMLIAGVAWFCGRGRRRRLLEDAMLFAQIGSLMMVSWAPTKHEFVYIYSPQQIVKWLRTPYPKREWEDITTKDGAKLLVSPVNFETGVAREAEQTKDATIAFDNIDYAALLWNNEFSNRVVWVGGAANQLAKANAEGATWIYTRNGTALHAAVVAKDSGWELVGALENEGQGSVWRKKR
jgi:hypothetical protein